MIPDPSDRDNAKRVEDADVVLWLYSAPNGYPKKPEDRIALAQDLMVDLLHYIANETKRAALADGDLFDFPNFCDEYLPSLFDSVDRNFREEFESDGPYPADPSTPSAPDPGS